MRVVVLGAGAWGCALASLLAETGHDVALWDVAPEHAARLARDRTHAYLGIRLPAALLITSELEQALREREMVVIATPSEFVRSTLTAARPHLSPMAVIVCAAKGLEAGTQLTMDQVIADVAPGAPVALLSGPTFAKEIAAGLPAAAVVAARDEAVAHLVQQGVSCARLRLYTTDDVVGVALGGALKNVIAIAIGVADGLKVGDNARAALITRGLSEMGRLALRRGAHPLTMAGLAGLGDLVLTCTGDLSRNRQVGLALAAGEDLASIVRRLGQVAEGVQTARTAAELARQLGITMPITVNVDAILHDGKPPHLALAEMLSREHRAERD
jgi:glycerol-3-phosphate dehydrogenase (NAD(P)+)